MVLLGMRVSKLFVADNVGEHYGSNEPQGAAIPIWLKAAVQIIRTAYLPVLGASRISLRHAFVCAWRISSSLIATWTMRLIWRRSVFGVAQDYQTSCIGTPSNALCLLGASWGANA